MAKPRKTKEALPPNTAPPPWYYYVVVCIPRRKTEEFKAKFLQDPASVAPPPAIQTKLSQASQLRLDLMEADHLGREGEQRGREIRGKLTKLEDEVMEWIDKEYR